MLKTVKFLALSFVAVFVFFVPVIKGQVLVVFLVNFIKESLFEFHQIIVLLFSFFLLISVILGKCLKVSWFKTRHVKDHFIEIVLYIISFICEFLILFEVGGDFLLNENVGGQVFSLSYTVLITILVSGFFVVFVIKSGVVEFFSGLVEPFMRKLFKVPGSAAVDCMSSFVSAASVGIYITNELYEDKKYTEREACIVASCFSVMSLGFMVVITQMAEIEHMTSYVILCSFIVMLVLAIICPRIPPLSRKRDVYIDGTTQDNISEEKKTLCETIKQAWENGRDKANAFKVKDILEYSLNSCIFAQKVIAMLIPPMILVLFVSEYTPIFEWIGYLIAPILVCLGLPNAQEIAPATIIGITEVTLPVISIAGFDVETKSRFFITVLSIVQIIYFTESANVILSSSINLSFKDLLKLFFIRTILAIPIVAFTAHFLWLILGANFV